MGEKKLVIKVDVPDGKGKQKAIKVVSSILGIDSIAMDMKERKMTVIGEVCPTKVVDKLRKHWHAEIVTFGPKEEPKPNKPDEKPKPEPAKDPAQHVADLLKWYQHYDAHIPPCRVIYCDPVAYNYGFW